MLQSLSNNRTSINLPPPSQISSPISTRIKTVISTPISNLKDYAPTFYKMHKYHIIAMGGIFLSILIILAIRALCKKPEVKQDSSSNPEKEQIPDIAPTDVPSDDQTSERPKKPISFQETIEEPQPEFIISDSVVTSPDSSHTAFSNESNRQNNFPAVEDPVQQEQTRLPIDQPKPIENAIPDALLIPIAPSPVGVIDKQKNLPETPMSPLPPREETSKPQEDALPTSSACASATMIEQPQISIRNITTTEKIVSKRDLQTQIDKLKAPVHTLLSASLACLDALKIADTPVTLTLKQHANPKSFEIINEGPDVQLPRYFYEPLSFPCTLNATYTPDFYTYQPTQPAHASENAQAPMKHVWVAFAAPKSGGKLLTRGFALEEQIFTEFIHLIALCGLTVRAGPSETLKGSPTPILIEGAIRVCICEKAQQLWGTLPNEIDDKLPTVLQPPSPPTDILLMAAPEHDLKKGSSITVENGIDLINSADAAISLLPPGTIIHTGLWGTGMFNQNPALSMFAQMLVARLRNCIIIFHGIKKHHEEAFKVAKHYVETAFAKAEDSAKSELKTTLLDYLTQTVSDFKAMEERKSPAAAPANGYPITPPIAQKQS